MKDRLSEDELNNLVRPSIDWLMSLSYSSGNLPSSIGSKSDRLVHWCHGAPGAIFLFTKAYKVNDFFYIE